VKVAELNEISILVLLDYQRDVLRGKNCKVTFELGIYTNIERMSTKLKHVRFEVSTAVTMMIIIFWEMTPCGSYKNRRFGGSYRLHFLGARVRTGYRAKL
jgi:hypothetical protein